METALSAAHLADRDESVSKSGFPPEGEKNAGRDERLSMLMIPTAGRRPLQATLDPLTSHKYLCSLALC